MLEGERRFGDTTRLFFELCAEKERCGGDRVVRIGLEHVSHRRPGLLMAVEMVLGLGQ